MTKKELQDYLIEEAEIGDKEVCGMSSEEMLDAWLTYNGIIGWTEDIIEVVAAAYERKVENHKNVEESITMDYGNNIFTHR